MPGDVEGAPGPVAGPEGRRALQATTSVVGQVLPRRTRAVDVPGLLAFSTRHRALMAGREQERPYITVCISYEDPLIPCLLRRTSR